MANTKEKADLKSKKKTQQILILSAWVILRSIALILFGLMLLFLTTEDFYDINKWNLSLGLRILLFLGLMFSLVFSFFKPRLSGYLIVVFSLSFWLASFILIKKVWLGWLFLIFPLLGFMFIIFSKIISLNNTKKLQRSSK
ncbi:MAG: hypothetical protein N2517_08075 [Ignavibacteria bacterium]|nr:hypothetical protein [Ignavibacteria bacterium]